MFFFKKKTRGPCHSAHTPPLVDSHLNVSPLQVETFTQDLNGTLAVRLRLKGKDDTIKVNLAFDGNKGETMTVCLAFPFFFSFQFPVQWSLP